MNEAEIKKRRLRWKCRRGMLELDLLLMHYFDHCYDTLDAEQQAVFETLIAQEDVALYAWFMGQKVPEDAKMRDMVAAIGAFIGTINTPSGSH